MPQVKKQDTTIPELPKKDFNPPRLLESLFEEYTQAYLNAKAKGELTPKIFFMQPNAKNIQESKGRFGLGVYARGKLVDRNVENPPNESLHSTDAMLVLNDKTMLEKYGTTNFKEARNQMMQDGYVGFQYDDDLYYLFSNTVPLTKNKVELRERDTELSTASMDVQKQGNKYIAQNINGEVNTVYKRGGRAYIEGQERSYRNVKSAIKALSEDTDFINTGIDQEVQNG